MQYQLESLIDRISEIRQCIKLELDGHSIDKKETVERLNGDFDRLVDELQNVCSQLGMEFDEVFSLID